jgi:hypothetical protein
MRFLLFLLLLVSTTTYAHGSSHAERCDSHREGITLNTKRLTPLTTPIPV